MKIEWREAHPKNYTQGRAAKIDRVVIHIAEGTYRCGKLTRALSPKSSTAFAS